MPKYERDTYEPDDVRVFDGGEDDDNDEGSHLPVVIVISLLVLAAFGGVVWLAYNNGVAHGRADVPAQTVAQNTVGEPPATAPGSGDIPAKQIKVYQQPAGADEDTVSDTGTAPAPMTKAATPTVRTQPAAPAKVAATRPAAAPMAAAKAPMKVADATPKPAPAPSKMVAEAPRPATAPPARLMPAKPVEKPAVKAAPAVAKPMPATVKTVSTANGVFVLQIGAYKSQGDAEAAWKAYRSKHAALLSGISSDVQKADLGDKGVWYRLRVGSFADKDAAAALCDRLKAEGGACFPAK